MHLAIDAIVPRLEERAALTCSERRVPDETIAELRAAGFLRLLQPLRHGGLEADPREFFRAQARLAEGCMSSAWVGGIIAVHAFQLALFDERAQQEVWSSDDGLISSSYAPLGKVTPVDGGFRLAGRWGWSSGSGHCAWVFLGAIVPDDGYRTFLLPISDYRIEDTWQAMGLQGTGSNDIVVQDAFVPEYRTHRQMDGFNIRNPGNTLNTGPLYRIPWGQLFCRTVSNPAIGATRAALRLFIHGCQNRSSNDPTKLAGDTHTQGIIARAELALAELDAVFERSMAQMVGCVGSGMEIPLADRVRYRYEASQIIEKSVAVVGELFANAGGRSVFLGSPIQQRFLDVNTARAHVANNPVPFARNFGAVQLGMENGDVFI
ncbi:MAG: flavin-dependent monooxygenase [Pseudomonadales bacterium]|nr:flavin-dependent monooxygenase [Pseudomonadales bacterium]MBP6227961.1 flavin-dependent monooxygenase [Pseudomonadales bacterium]